MSVCQYYLRGFCRFGDQCRQLHESNQNDSSLRARPPRQPIDPKYNYRSSNIVKKDHYTDNKTVSKHENSHDSEVLKWIYTNFENRDKALNIIKQLQIEAKVWLKSINLWRFTSKSLFPGGHPLEDWSDVSFEEMKWQHRCMTDVNQEHVFTKQYFEYVTKVERQLVGLEKLRIETLESLKNYINEYIASNYRPSIKLQTDVEMKDINDNTTATTATSTSIFTSQIQSTKYTPHDQLLETERAAFESDTFEFGNIPIHAPSKEFC